MKQLLVWFPFVVGVVLALTKPENGSQQRLAMFMEHLVSGHSNVGWETRPTQGNPIKIGGHCVDALGELRKDGEEYMGPSEKFTYVCKHGQEEVVACVASDRAGNARVPVGFNVEVNGFWHKCQSFPNGSIIYYDEPSCFDYTGREIHVGDEFNAGHLRLACDDGGYSTIGCIYHDNNDEEVVLKQGESNTVGNYTHICENVDGGFRYKVVQQNGCVMFDRELKEAETFSQGHLHYQCNGGVVEVTGCYVDEKKDLKVGEDFVRDNVIHRCIQNGDALSYQTSECVGESCKPVGTESVETTADALPPAFTIVHRIEGGDKGLDPEVIAARLDKLFMRGPPLN